MSGKSVTVLTNLSVDGVWIAIEDLKSNTFQVKKFEPGTVLLREGEAYSVNYLLGNTEQQLLDTIRQVAPDMKRVNVVGDPL